MSTKVGNRNATPYKLGSFGLPGDILSSLVYWLTKPIEDSTYPNKIGDQEREVQPGRALAFNGVDQHATNAAISESIKTISFFIELGSTTEDILQLSSSVNLTVASGTLAGNGITSPTIYVDNVASSTIDTDRHHVIITSATAFTVDDIDLAHVTGYGEFSIDDIRFFPDQLTSDERALLQKKSRISDEVAWYFCEDESIARVYDASGNGYHLTAEGFDSASFVEGNWRSLYNLYGYVSFYSPIQLTIDYTSTQFVFKFKLPSTSVITLNWGDGSQENVIGQDGTEITKTSSYSSSGEYSFSVAGDFTDLTSINISAQSFVSGDISSWSALTNLTNLRCNSTSVSGDISSWSALTSLIYLYCNTTSVNGDVSSWSALTNLNYLQCNTTSVTGDVSSWSALTSLTYLRCNSTSVSGDISSWSVLTNLTYLYCDSTSVSGDVSSWSALTNLVYLRCNSTSVTGDVSSWSALTSLTYLECTFTSISGDVSSWSALTNLISLYCHTTSISGDVSSWSALTNLNYLYCNSTSVTGDVSSWSALTNLISLYCDSTAVDFNGTAAWSMSGTISLYSNGWTSTQVDNCLAALAGTPVTGCTINIGGTNAVRTSASDADVTTITTPANSNTLTVNE